MQPVVCDGCRELTKRLDALEKKVAGIAEANGLWDGA